MRLFQRLDHGPCAQIDAMSAMISFVETRKRLARNARQHAVEGFKHCNLLAQFGEDRGRLQRSEEHTSELQSLMRISYAVFCLKNKNKENKYNMTHSQKLT